MSLLELSPTAWEGADRLLAARPERILGTFRAAAVAGNAVTGSIFYTLPAVIAAAGMWSPISLFIACLLIAPFRWVMVELCDAFGAADSANYAFFTHTASMAIATVAAAATALDALSTGAVSASTAATYLAPLTPGMNEALWAVVLLVALAVICCLGLGDSSRVALGMLSFHLISMTMILVSAAVWWGQNGSDTLRANWDARATLITGNKSIARALFDGVCAAFVGLTGFECAPSYAGHVKRGAFPTALWSLQVAVLLIEPALMLLCLAGLSTQQLSDAASGGSANLLALLGQRVVKGDWLRIWITVDAALVLAGGIITGVISFCGLLAALGSDRILPSIVLRLIPRTKAPFVGIGTFLVIALVLEATTNFTLSSLSQVFSLSFLVLLALYTIVLFLARLRRPALFQLTTTTPNRNDPDGSRSVPHKRLTLPMIWIAFGIAATAIGGNIALNPHSLLLYALYALVLWVLLDLARTRVVMVRLLLWVVRECSTDLAQWLPHGQNFDAQEQLLSLGPGECLRPHNDSSALTIRNLGAKLRSWIQRERQHPMIYFAADDELSELVGVLSYVAANEPVAHVYVVHCFGSVEQVPSEIESNYQLVDESFPTITVDLVFVESIFCPRTALAIASHFQVSPSRCLVGCPRPDASGQGWDMSDLSPLRIIHT